MSKDELIEKGIYKPEAVFGNDLVSLAHTCFPNLRGDHSTSTYKNANNSGLNDAREKLQTSLES